MKVSKVIQLSCGFTYDMHAVVESSQMVILNIFLITICFMIATDLQISVNLIHQ